MAIALTVPAGFRRRLSELTELPGLDVVLDEEATVEHHKPVWHVVYTERGEPTHVTSWQGQLDGAVDAIAYRCRRVDYRRRDPRQYAREIDDKQLFKTESRKRSHKTTMKGVSGYMRRCLQAVYYGEPSVGAR